MFLMATFVYYKLILSVASKLSYAHYKLININMFQYLDLGSVDSLVLIVHIYDFPTRGRVMVGIGQLHVTNNHNTQLANSFQSLHITNIVKYRVS